ARCHDHKLDPIPTSDYYGLYSVINSSRTATHTLDLDTVNERTFADIRGHKAEIQGELAGLWRAQTGELRAKLEAAAVSEGEDRLEDPLAQAARLREAASFPEAYAELRQRTVDEAARRAASRGAEFTEFGKFDGKLPKGWTEDGLGLRGGPA